ncbi:hypothetical protein AWZ03_014518 [Drosophila navojoa]|uniref:Uncharacterized protein n=1 Tax=Drosophila navojoa TaxID=7232 RepID=A0A484AT57_DRONA|nr:uncharacterized protein LOC115565347 isoform X1 [Drosophila navojoa]TDG39060.1 hypothetical protein AWZ03_014518 [Drosophila navojoa]
MNNKKNVNTTPPSCTNTIVTDSTVSVSVSASVSSANSSTSSRRQRHSIAGQMSYMKMLGFGGFSKKMATSANSLFSTAVISGSSSAPNLRDMIPVSSSGFGDVPPIRPLETLHNALSLRKLDSFLQDMVLAQIFKTPTGSPPRIREGAAGSNSVSLLTPGIGQHVSVSMPSDSMAAFSSMIEPRDDSVSATQLIGRTAPISGKCDQSSISDPNDDQTQSSDFDDPNDVVMKHILPDEKQRKFCRRKSRTSWRN